MNKQTRFFLINGSKDIYWSEALGKTLNSLGDLQVGTESDALNFVDLSTYDLIFIDSAAVRDVPSLVACLRSGYPKARLLVVTASPTWRRAREAFEAGAVDYIRKPFDREDVIGAVQRALQKVLPPWL